uniref:Uncharacterized protein n=1 Tax=Vespula pensylvanica TaxID=30213 RepID=A0A834PCC5_VESPE|nr:hypothetical protein H0235_003626 [Vespula pensylvanica]
MKAFGQEVAGKHKEYKVASVSFFDTTFIQATIVAERVASASMHSPNLLEIVVPRSDALDFVVSKIQEANLTQKMSQRSFTPSHESSQLATFLDPVLRNRIFCLFYYLFPTEKSYLQ